MDRFGLLRRYVLIEHSETPERKAVEAQDGDARIASGIWDHRDVVNGSPYSEIHWSTPGYTGVSRSTPEYVGKYVGIHRSTLEYVGVH